MRPLITAFSARRPAVEVKQDRALAWLARAHAHAEILRGRVGRSDEEASVETMRRRLNKFGCSPDQIGSRGSVLADFGHDDFERMTIYDRPHGRGTAARSRVFAEAVNAYFASEYERETEAPADLVHVTCTGYVSPSGAQRLVAERGWGGKTRVTHAYHMGCYAAFPALRIASGHVHTGSARVDVVHTELCSLHLDPGDHSAEQLVVQSLFGDGMIRYSVLPEGGGEHGLELLLQDEIVLPDSAEAMRWVVGDHGLQMTLSREVPEKIAGELVPFVERLLRGGGSVKDSIWAVHPGGPRIIDGVRDALGLDEAQVSHSRRVLFDHGNMSSATLPHVWQRIVRDEKPGTLVVSLAFGPGLTVSGAVMRVA